MGMENDAPGATDGVVESVRQLERLRCRALVHRNFDALRELVDPGLVHIHTSGRVENYKTYFEFLASGVDFLQLKRGQLRIDRYAGAAMMSGIQEMTLVMPAWTQARRIGCVVTQLWVLRPEGWRQASFHATLADPKQAALSRAVIDERRANHREAAQPDAGNLGARDV